MIRWRALALAAAVVVAGGLSTGCGGDGSTSSASSDVCGPVMPTALAAGVEPISPSQGQALFAALQQCVGTAEQTYRTAVASSCNGSGASLDACKRAAAAFTQTLTVFAAHLRTTPWPLQARGAAQGLAMLCDEYISIVGGPATRAQHVETLADAISGGDPDLRRIDATMTSVSGLLAHATNITGVPASIPATP